MERAVGQVLNSSEHVIHKGEQLSEAEKKALLKLSLQEVRDFNSKQLYVPRVTVKILSCNLLQLSGRAYHCAEQRVDNLWHLGSAGEMLFISFFEKMHRFPHLCSHILPCLFVQVCKLSSCDVEWCALLLHSVLVVRCTREIAHQQSQKYY